MAIALPSSPPPLERYELYHRTREGTITPADVVATFREYSKPSPAVGVDLPEIRTAIGKVAEDLTIAELGNLTATSMRLRGQVGSDQLCHVEEIGRDLANIAATRGLEPAHVMYRATKSRRRSE